MNKSKTIFQCYSCGHVSSKWTGKCVECGEWNTISEKISSPIKKDSSFSIENQKPQLLNDVAADKTQRLKVKDGEFNRVLGGGIVPGSVILNGGEPGIGKSTLTLKIGLALSSTVLYVAGEESNEQIKMRANRLKVNNEKCFIYNETNVSSILQASDKINPSLIIIDSIQTLYVDNIDASPGSVSQIRHSADQLIRYSKNGSIPISRAGEE